MRTLKAPSNLFFEHFFSLDCILPSQVGPRYAHPSPGELRLNRAVLEAAINDLIRLVEAGLRNSRMQKEFESVIEWFSLRNSEWPTSFEQICTTIDLDADAVRDQIRRWYVRNRPRGVRAPRTLL